MGKLLKLALLLPIVWGGILGGELTAQELDCEVIINSESVQTQERKIFETMQQAIGQFMNTTQWTDDQFQEHEKIKCTLLITLGNNSTIQNYTANVQVQSMRPVYGTDYESPVCMFFDEKWQFQYNESDPLIFTENSYSTELTSLLAYYAYVIIGMDYDTFSPKGGDKYYNKALNILTNAQQSGGAGWSIIGDKRNRGWIVENLLNPQFEPFRVALYDYHRQAMDGFEKDANNSREVVFACLEKVQEVYEVQPQNINTLAFFDAKGAELLNIFSRGEVEVRQNAVNLLTQLNPRDANRYKKLLK
ncbi:DUF4835 family protein [Rapidithrix thailandica]|uniref:DUF4835 family protein n=1 Tax=Rapidithrix thailandica TaxID=413964 RepID=A0AAW9S199_9BACT